MFGADDRLTSSLFVWLAAISVACSAYVAIKAANCHCDPWDLDYYPRYGPDDEHQSHLLILVNVLYSTCSMLYFAAVGIFLVLAYMALHHYFGRNRYSHAPPSVRVR